MRDQDAETGRPGSAFSTWVSEMASGPLKGDELDGVDFNAVEDFGAAFAGVPEDEVVSFGAHDVPGVAVRAGVDGEIGVFVVPVSRRHE